MTTSTVEILNQTVKTLEEKSKELRGIYSNKLKELNNSVNWFDNLHLTAIRPSWDRKVEFCFSYEQESRLSNLLTVNLVLKETDDRKYTFDSEDAEKIEADLNWYSTSVKTTDKDFETRKDYIETVHNAFTYASGIDVYFVNFKNLLDQYNSIEETYAKPYREVDKQIEELKIIIRNKQKETDLSEAIKFLSEEKFLAGSYAWSNSTRLYTIKLEQNKKGNYTVNVNGVNRKVTDEKIIDMYKHAKIINKSYTYCNGDSNDMSKEYYKFPNCFNSKEELEDYQQNRKGIEIITAEEYNAL